VRKVNASKSLLAAGAIALVVAAAAFLWTNGRDTNQMKRSTTTETAAAAKVTPTEPQLKVEPK
jgi:hypothetical protein